MRAAYWLLWVAALTRLAHSQTVEPKWVTVPELRTILAQNRGTILVHFTSTDKACIPCLESNAGIPGAVGREHWVHPFLRVSWSIWTAPPAGLPISSLDGLPMLVVFVNGKAVKDYVGYSAEKEDEIVSLLRPFNHGQPSFHAAPAGATGPPAASLRFSVPRVSLLWGQTYATTLEARNAQGKPMVPLPALQWSSSAENIAAVDEAGRIHTIRRGQAIITVRSGSAVATIAVDVTGFADLSTTDTDTTCAITDNRHEIYCWGNAANNRIFAKNAPNAPSYSAPVQIQPGELPPNTKIVSLAIGRWAICALTDSGRAYCWGDSAQRAVPTALQAGEIPASAKLSSLAVGASEACGIASDAQIYCWGVSNPAKPARMILGEIPPNEKLTAIGVGRSGACVIADGDGYCWLSGEKPQLVSPGDLPASVKLTSLSFSDQAACALGDDGHAYCFDQASKDLPVWKLVPFAVKLKEFAACQYCGIGENHHLYCGGKALPIAVAFQKITCAPNYCAALSEDGRIYSWGAAQNEAELGHPANPNPALPELINAPQ